jgi:hypothetical protein
MLGTIPDFSQSKHIDLTHNVGEYENESLIASCFSDSFGDKIIYYRMYMDNKYVSCFETIGIERYHEGNHPNMSEMIETAQRLKKTFKGE